MLRTFAVGRLRILSLFSQKSAVRWQAAKGSNGCAFGRLSRIFLLIANNALARESFRRNEVTYDITIQQKMRDAAVKKLMDDLGFGHSFIPGL
jgi:hypothetical protein